MSAARILVVDDDDGVRGVAVRQLGSLGHEVIAAASGNEALALLEGTLRDGSPPIDLLFVDVAMPGMDGFEVAARATQARPQLKVLFASGNFDAEKFTAGDAGNGRPCETRQQFIVKPYRKQELAEKIREMLGTHPSSLGGR